jgi:hypothetical protein
LYIKAYAKNNIRDADCVGLADFLRQRFQEVSGGAGQSGDKLRVSLDQLSRIHRQLGWGYSEAKVAQLFNRFSNGEDTMVVADFLHGIENEIQPKQTEKPQSRPASKKSAITSKKTKKLALKAGRVVVALPLTAQCTGKTTSFRMLQDYFEEPEHGDFLFINSGSLKDSMASMMNGVHKAVAVIKSSDEYTARMIKEHDGDQRQTEAEIRKECHGGFWKELDADFMALCEYVKATNNSAVLIIDKVNQRMFNTFSSPLPSFRHL